MGKKRVSASFRRQCIGEQAHPLGNVFFHGLLADSKTLCDFLLRQLLYPAQPNYFAATVGQLIKGSRQSMQRLAAATPAFW